MRSHGRRRTTNPAPADGKGVNLVIVKVPSEKNPEILYTVDTETGTCDCPHFQKRLKDENAADGGIRVCKHCSRAREYLAKQKG